MDKFQIANDLPLFLMPLILFLIILELLWKMIALWKSARNNHLVWFICIGLFNTLGILPIIYILIQKKKE